MGETAAAIIAGIGVAVSAGSAAYSGVAASDAQDKQNANAAAARAQQDEALNMAKDQASKQDQALADQQAQAASSEAKNIARERQRSQAAGAYGRSSTILTSPLGIPNQPAAPGKTLLGG